MSVVWNLDKTWAAAAVSLPYLLGDSLDTIFGTDEVSNFCSYRLLVFDYSFLVHKMDVKTA